jgi:Domain of unknown function (DUF4157)
MRPVKKTTQPTAKLQNKGVNDGKEATLKSKPPVLFQAQLSVGSPDDPYEQEADKVSRQVMDNYEQVTSVQRTLFTLGLQTSIQPMPVGNISRKLQRRLFRRPVVQFKCDQCEKEEKLHAKTDRIQFDGDRAIVSSQIESSIQAQRGSGNDMDPITKTAMESSFGADFSSVKIHTDSTAVQMSRDLNAHAFTVGNDIFFNEGRYQPQTKWGAGLLAHELTHVVQQGAAVQNKTISRLPCSDLFSNSTISKLSSVGGHAAQQATLYRKEIAQFQKEVPEEKMLMQQKQMLQAKEIDKVQTHSNAKVMRLYGGGGTTPPATRKAKLRSGPTYTPNGNLTPGTGGSGKQVSFNLAAEFEHDPPNGIFAPCGEIRQDIQWDATMAASFASTGGVPHNGFPAGHPHSTWIEDRSPGDTIRLGHRTGKFATPLTMNRFEDASGTADMANGAKYVGNDRPSMLTTDKGTMFFRFYAIDVCNGNNKIGATDTITIKWG